MRDEGAAAAALAAAGGTVVEPREVTLDATAPTTSLQLRMPDGTRKVLKLNHSHTVNQLRAHVATLLVPRGAPFELATSMPRAKLLDGAATMSGAGLLNNTVVVTML
jgi:hypothetical protein